METFFYSEKNKQSFVVIACLLITFCMGSLHAFSTLIENIELQIDVSRMASSLVYSTALICVTVAVFFGHILLPPTIPIINHIFNSILTINWHPYFKYWKLDWLDNWLWYFFWICKWTRLWLFTSCCFICCFKSKAWIGFRLSHSILCIWCRRFFYNLSIII